jgi:hypothetical protein
VYEAEQALRETFDVVYTGIGALCWLPDIARWARVAAACIRPGGLLYIYEGHPMLWTLDEQRSDGQLVAYAADDGKKLWSFDARTGVLAGPVTYTVGKDQYVAVAAGGPGGAFGMIFGDLVKMAGVDTISRVLIFKLDAGSLPQAPKANQARPRQVARHVVDKVASCATNLRVLSGLNAASAGFVRTAHEQGDPRVHRNRAWRPQAERRADFRRPAVDQDTEAIRAYVIMRRAAGLQPARSRPRGETWRRPPPVLRMSCVLGSRRSAIGGPSRAMRLDYSSKSPARHRYSPSQHSRTTRCGCRQRSSSCPWRRRRQVPARHQGAGKDFRADRNHHLRGGRALFDHFSHRPNGIPHPRYLLGETTTESGSTPRLPRDSASCIR